MDYKNAQELLEFIKGVTPGPWMAIADTFEYRVNTKLQDGCRGIGVGIVFRPNENPDIGQCNAQFIAMSREALPYWIERAAQAESELDERRELQEAQSKAIVREQKRAEQAERAVERLLDALDHGARCPQAGMWDDCHDYSDDAKCRACRKAWAAKEGK